MPSTSFTELVGRRSRIRRAPMGAASTPALASEGVGRVHRVSSAADVVADLEAGTERLLAAWARAVDR